MWRNPPPLMKAHECFPHRRGTTGRCTETCDWPQCDNSCIKASYHPRTAHDCFQHAYGTDMLYLPPPHRRRGAEQLASSMARRWQHGSSSNAAQLALPSIWERQHAITNIPQLDTVPQGRHPHAHPILSEPEGNDIAFRFLVTSKCPRRQSMIDVRKGVGMSLGMTGA